MRERLQSPGEYCGGEFIRRNAFGDVFEDGQGEIAADVARKVVLGAVFDGTFTSAQLVQFGLTWKGSFGFLGWGALAPTLPPELRASSAYIMGHRALRLNQPGPATDLLKLAASLRESNPKVAERATADLKLLAAAQVAQKATPAPVPVGPHVRTRVWLDVPGGRVSIRIQSVGSTPIAVDTAMLAQIGTWVAATSAGTSIPPPKKDGYHPQSAAYLLPGEAIGVDLAPDELAIIASIDANVRAKRTVALSLPQVWTCNEQGWELITPQMDSTEAFTATALREG